MAEEEAAEEQEQVAPKKSRLNQFMALAVLVLLGQSAILYLVITKLVIPRIEANGEETETVEQMGPVERPIIPIDAPFIYAIMPDMMINPPDDEALRFLKVKVVLQMDSEAALTEIVEDPVVGNKVQDLVREHLGTTPFRKMDDTPERESLRGELKRRVNDSGLLQNGEVMAVYFQQFLLQ